MLLLCTHVIQVPRLSAQEAAVADGQRSTNSCHQPQGSCAHCMSVPSPLVAMGAGSVCKLLCGFSVTKVLVLCFAILFGSCAPMKSSWSRSDDYTTTTGV